MSELARRIGRVDPTDSASAYNAGLDALHNGLEPEGLRLLEAARRSAPGDAGLWLVAGLLYRQLDDLASAIAMFAEAVRLAPRDPLIVESLARAHLEAGLPSLELFEAARRLAPRDGNLLLGLVAATENDEGPEAAITAMKRILAEHPGWIPGLEQLIRLRWLCGDREGFAAAHESALAAQPRNLDLWRSLIVSLVQAERYELALDAVMRGRAQAGPDLIFDANEAIARTELGQFAAAERLFAHMAAVDEPVVRVRHVRHLLRTGRPAEAAALAEPMTSTPAADFFWPYLSIAWRLLGDERRQWLEGDERFVGVYDLELPSLDALAERLRSLHNTTHPPFDQSVRGGSQTQGNLLSRVEPEIRSLRAAAAAAVERHVAQLPPARPGHPLLAAPRGRRVRFAGSWSVRLADGGHHANHIHPAGWLSSALYIALPDAPEPAGWLTLGVPQAELGIDLPPIRRIEPKPGRLVLFPSTLWHGTIPFEAGERLTVAFDVARPV